MSTRRLPDVCLDFDAVDTAPASIRHAVRDWFASDDDVVSDVETVASELVTNVVLHTGEPGRFELWDERTRNLPTDAGVRVEVHDASHDPARPRPSASKSGGFGLRIVDALSRAWGYIVTTTGKTTWAVVPTVANEGAALVEETATTASATR